MISELRALNTAGCGPTTEKLNEKFLRVVPGALVKGNRKLVKEIGVGVWEQ